MSIRPIMLVGAPVGVGAGRPGCALGPAALRGAGLAPALRRSGHSVSDAGDVAPGPWRALTHPNPVLRGLGEVAAWTAALADVAFAASAGHVPVFLGGDHSLSCGTVAGLARRAGQEGRPLFVLWIDAHADCHTLDSSESGNLHGVPLAYAMGMPGFEGWMPPLVHAVGHGRACVVGARSVDAAEHETLRDAGIEVHGPKAVTGTAGALSTFLDRVRRAGGLLHVSLDADALDPAVAPGVGTPVPGGVTLPRARAAMALVHGSGLVRGLDLVEVNPGLDPGCHGSFGSKPGGRTADAMVDLATCLLGGDAVLERQAA